MLQKLHTEKVTHEKRIFGCKRKLMWQERVKEAVPSQTVWAGSDSHCLLVRVALGQQS